MDSPENESGVRGVLARAAHTKIVPSARIGESHFGFFCSVSIFFLILTSSLFVAVCAFLGLFNPGPTVLLVDIYVTSVGLGVAAYFVGAYAPPEEFRVVSRVMSWLEKLVFVLLCATVVLCILVAAFLVALAIMVHIGQVDLGDEVPKPQYVIVLAAAVVFGAAALMLVRALDPWATPTLDLTGLKVWRRGLRRALGGIALTLLVVSLFVAVAVSAGVLPEAGSASVQSQNSTAIVALAVTLLTWITSRRSGRFQKFAQERVGLHQDLLDLNEALRCAWRETLAQRRWWRVSADTVHMMHLRTILRRFESTYYAWYSMGGPVRDVVLDSLLLDYFIALEVALSGDREQIRTSPRVRWLVREICKEFPSERSLIEGALPITDQLLAGLLRVGRPRKEQRRSGG